MCHEPNCLAPALPDVSGENFDAAINAELHKISTFYVDKEEELDVSGTASRVDRPRVMRHMTAQQHCCVVQLMPG